MGPVPQAVRCCTIKRLEYLGLMIDLVQAKVFLPLGLPVILQAGSVSQGIHS